MLQSARGKQERAAQIAPILFLCFLLFMLLEEFIASSAPAGSQDLFGLLHFESALAFHFPVSSFTHALAYIFFVVIGIPPHLICHDESFPKCLLYDQSEKISQAALRWMGRMPPPSHALHPPKQPFRFPFSLLFHDTFIYSFKEQKSHAISTHQY